MKPHIGGISWEEIYAGAMAKGPWNSSQFQFYWRQHMSDLDVVRKVSPPSEGVGDGGHGPDWPGDVCPPPLADGTPAVRHGAENICPPCPPELVAKL